MTKLDRKMAATRLEVDQTKQEKNDWQIIFEKDKQDILADIHDWTERYPFLMVRDELVQQTSRNMYNLYEPTTYETIRTPFVGVNKDRKSTRLNSSHVAISYAVFCLKKKKISVYR